MASNEDKSRQYRIAIDMRDSGELHPFLYRVWKLRKDGHTFFGIRDILRQSVLTPTQQEMMETPEMQDRARRLGNSVTSLKRHYVKAQEKIEEAELEEEQGCRANQIGYTGERSGDSHFFTDGVLVKFLG